MERRDTRLASSLLLVPEERHAVSPFLFRVRRYAQKVSPPRAVITIVAFCRSKLFLVNGHTEIRQTPKFFRDPVSVCVAHRQHDIVWVRDYRNSYFLSPPPWRPSRASSKRPGSSSLRKYFPWTQARLLSAAFKKPASRGGSTTARHPAQPGCLHEASRTSQAMDASALLGPYFLLTSGGPGSAQSAFALPFQLRPA